MRKTSALKLILVMVVLAGVSAGQVTPGAPPFASMGVGPFDSVDLGNLNAYLVFPVRHKAGRGTAFDYKLSYDSSVWYPVGSSGSQSWQLVSSTSLPGWKGLSPAGQSYIGYTMAYSSGQCYNGSGYNNWQVWSYSSFYYVDQKAGVRHSFSGGWAYATNSGSGCGPTPGYSPSSATQSSLAPDGSGYSLVVTPVAGGNATPYVVDRQNTNINAPIIVNQNPGSETWTDRNGNQLTTSNGVHTDTLGTTALSVSGTAPSNTSLSYTAPSGATASYVVKYTTSTVQTKFGCSGVSEFGPSSQNLVTEIDLPDISQNPNSKYTLTYETTPGDTHTPHYVTGRIAKVTLPTGGSISYTYNGANDGINCTDGSTLSLTRTLSNGDTWQYSRSGSFNSWTTTITDPASNQTVINFAKDSGSLNTGIFYETQRKVYQGSSTLLGTTIGCYNGNYANCATAAVSAPITQTDTYHQLANGSASLSELKYDGFGIATDDKEYDYGVNMGAAPTTTVVRETISPTTVFAGYFDTYTSIQTVDGAGNTLANTLFYFDQNTPTGTSSPQHQPGVNSGNVTEIKTQVNSSSWLYKYFSYYDTGNVKTATDVNNAQTSYTYGACGNSFPTSVSKPLGLTRSMTYDSTCAGGVVTSVTDENSQKTTTAYTDPYFWRPASSTDPLNNVTSTSYTPTTTESYMNFASNSTLDVLATVDALGSAVFSQKRQAQGSSTFDSTQTTYGWATSGVTGAFRTVSMPYAAAAGQGAPTGTAVTTTQYDAVGRLSSTKDGGGGTVSYTYTNNDALQTVGPTRTFQKQFEYDGLGRLTSVCEVSTASGHGTCSQTSSQSGFWTRYKYDAAGRLIGVCQNTSQPLSVDCVASPSTGQQTRTFSYDMLGRMTSETNPESGTTTYVYDSASNPCGWGQYNNPGNLIQKTDANGQSTCYQNDALHRLAAVGNSATSACKRFFYDNSLGVLGSRPSGVSISNGLGRLVEAETDTCVFPVTQSSIITDEWFSYSARGEVTDFWESTPHSGTYYHPTHAYWASGALKTFWISSLPSITYNVDGEGRTSTVSASSGQNPVTLTNYNAASQVTKVTFGSGDGDEFFYDSNTGRMTQYKLWVNGSNEYGNLGWNANGTLGSLAITDPFNSADNNQNCTYAYDNLARLSSVGCGAAWSQTFSYDAFGNISKTGSISWQPGYNSSTNRYTLGGTSYDADGNLLNDTFHSYSWTVFGRPATIDSIGLTYDAFDRMVEQNQSGTYYQLVYTPSGTKLGTFSGSTIQQLYIPLPGHTSAEYLSWGLSHYRHSDWLGSDRLESGASDHSIKDSNAYAPFGEPYAQTGNGELSFTGQNKDTTWLQYDFLVRQYDPKQGRWISPDPAGSSAANPMTPQSWNRYAYVLNNPLSAVDPDGRDCVYLNDEGTGIEEVDPGSCDEGTGGTWVPGTYSGYWADTSDGGNIVGLNSTVGDQGFISELNGDDSLSSLVLTSASAVSGALSASTPWPGSGAGLTFSSVSQEQNIVGLITGLELSGYSGLPNYYSLNYALGGWAGNIQLSDTGHWYFTELGVGTPGFSVTAGWIDTPGITADEFLPGWGGSACFFGGASGGCQTYSPGYGTATELGAGTPGPGISGGYTFCQSSNQSGCPLNNWP